MAQPNWRSIYIGYGQARRKKELLRIVKCWDNHLGLILIKTCLAGEPVFVSTQNVKI